MRLEGARDERAAVGLVDDGAIQRTPLYGAERQAPCLAARHERDQVQSDERGEREDGHRLQRRAEILPSRPAQPAEARQAEHRRGVTARPAAAGRGHEQKNPLLSACFGERSVITS